MMSPLRVGFILLDAFTLAGFAGLVEALRLAADSGGGSRQIYASWTIMSEEGRICRASCGAAITETNAFLDPCQFDYIAVCGGNSYQSVSTYSPQLLSYLRKASQHNVRLIGVCTGTFVLAKAGLIGPRSICVNWNVADAFHLAFPDITARTDMLFLDEGDVITCAGSTAAIDLGLYLIARHCGSDKARQASRHMILQGTRPARMPQPHFSGEFAEIKDIRVQQAIHFMSQRIDAPPSIEATARYIGVSSRQLERVFHTELEMSPKTVQLQLRLQYGRWLLLNSSQSIMEIAFSCGFSDAAHFSREYKKCFQSQPSAWRK